MQFCGSKSNNIMQEITFFISYEVFSSSVTTLCLCYCEYRCKFFSVFFSQFFYVPFFLMNDFFFNFCGKGQTFTGLLLFHVISILFLCFQVSLFNFVFLIAWALALPYAQFRPLASSICTVWTCVIIVCKMLYQLTSIDPSTFSSNCTLVSTSAY